MPARALFALAAALWLSGPALARVTDGSLTVLTLNTWNVNGPFLERADLIAKGIEDERPDVVALQEVLDPDPAEGEDVPFNLARELGRRLGYHVLWQEAARVPIGRGTYPEGLALLARDEVVGSSFAFLSVPSGGPRRIILQATITTPFGLVNVFTTHLSTDAGDRQVEAKEVWRFMKPLASSLPVVLLGDFNSLSFSPPIRFLRGLFPIDGEVGGLRDLWEELRPTDPGYTFSTTNNAGELLNRRLDYVFVGPTTPEGSGQGLEIRTVLAEKGPSGFTASDHLGVLARLREVGSPDPGYSTGPSGGGCAIGVGSPQTGGLVGSVVPLLGALVTRAVARNRWRLPASPPVRRAEPRPRASRRAAARGASRRTA